MYAPAQNATEAWMNVHIHNLYIFTHTYTQLIHIHASVAFSLSRTECHRGHRMPSLSPAQNATEATECLLSLPHRMPQRPQNATEYVPQNATEACICISCVYVCMRMYKVCVHIRLGQVWLELTECHRGVNIIAVGLGISRTNADSQWNPVYKAIHRICGCGNEMIRR